MRRIRLRSDSCGQKRINQLKTRPQVEQLEIRNLMTAFFGSTSRVGMISGGVCTCPICSGQGLNALTSQGPEVSPVPSESGLEESVPVSSVPQYSSNSGATAKLFLDFNGRFTSSWGSNSNITTPAYDTDGDTTTFSDSELTNIYRIWASVAEDYAPFNIDVTTIDPGALTDKVVACVAIGGSNSDWYGSSAGGVAYVGGFYNSSSNTAFVFENNLGNGNVKYTSEAIAHEAGHLFGLSHQATWNGTTLVSAYSQGDSNWAPIMGVGYYSTRTTWHNGQTSASYTTYQDNIAILSNSSNGFGMKADDFGSTIATASQLPQNGTSVNFSGLLGHHTDQDVWQFTTSGGSISFSLNVAQYGPNLDSILELRNSSGTLIASSDSSTSLNSAISTTLGSGTFYVTVRSNGTYGNMGQYTLTGTLPAAVQNPEITVLIGSTSLASGGTLDFGQTSTGSAVDRTVTIRNDGNGTLNLNSINAGSLPTGFTLVSNISNLQLTAGASTSFVLRLSGAAAGSYSGTLNLTSDDADEGTFGISLTGSVVTPTWGAIDFFLLENRTTTGNMWYNATATRAGWFSAEAYFDNNLGNVDIEVYDGNNQLLGSSSSTANAERVDVLVTAGQQLSIRIVGANSNVTYRCVNLVSFSGDTINVYGTASDDLLVMLPGSGTHRVAVNGVGYDFDAALFDKIVVQDNGGVDTLIVVGNEQDETAVVSQTSATVNGSGYQLTATGTEFVQLQAGDGSDSATFHDRAGDDVYTGNPTEGTLSGAGYNFKATGFDVVSVEFTGGGFDQAFLYGSIGDDHYEASRDSAFLQGPGFRHEAAGYVTVVGVGGAGNDLALLLDSTSDDIYNGDPNAATLSNANMYLRAELFDRVEARSTGGYDVAYLKDSPGNDVMGASKILAYFNGVGFSNYVEGFDFVHATSTGGLDSVDLYDSAGDDLLTINGASRRLEIVGDYAIQTDGFRTFRAFASAGNDRVTMQQLLNTDKIQGRLNWATLTNGNGRTHTATGFDVVTAVAKSKQKPRTDVRDIDYLFSKVGW